MMFLNMVQSGEQVKVVAIRGGGGVQQRLESMGFVPGCVIQMVANQMEGPCIIKVKGSRVALGRGLMHHIMVDGITALHPVENQSCRRSRHRRMRRNSIR